MFSWSSEAIFSARTPPESMHKINRPRTRRGYTGQTVQERPVPAVHRGENFGKANKGGILDRQHYLVE